jgi:DNA helicase-2/ATP-dependent DNA helicase PcrA
MKSFSSELERLNPDQRRAVDTIEGPVMVVAGPGTGKTQTLGMRVANILKRTQVRPGNILCLTFSNSGATAMRERLRKLIGPDAYGVAVHTIHGFCNECILQHPTVFERWSALEQISDVERYRLVRSIIDELLPNLELVNKKDPHRGIADILSRISLLKREGKTDEQELKRIADENESVLASASREGTKAHENNLRKARKFRELVEVYLRYQKQLEATGRYDYDDMILNVLAALREHDWLLASLQERYLYILVDEFQDTNGSQYALIDLLTQPRTPEDHPNLFVVGDDDQAIYRFQGANLTNILSFHRRFPKAPVIVLKTSYRCPQPVLDAAAALIQHNTERLVGRIPDLDKTLVSAVKKKSPSPALLLSPSDMTEPWLLADMIEERIGEGIAPQEIAVLTQTNAELRPIYDVLTARGIPVQMTGRVDLLLHPLVQQAIAILKAVHKPGDSGLLGAAMACECFGCHPADLGRVFDARREAKGESTLVDVLLSIGEKAKKDDVLALADRKSLLHARDVLLDLHNKLGSRTVVETVEKALKQSGLLQVATVEGKAVDPLDYAALQEFFDRVKYRCYESPAFSFRQFMDDLEMYGDPDYGDLRLTYDLPHLTDAGIQLMTAHRSKGLEFHTVFLTNFRDRHWNNRMGHHGISIPEDLLFGWEKEQKSFEKGQDERRVAFVAMTRAKHELVFTCPKQLTSGDRNKAVSPSAFFAEAGELPEQEKELKKPDEAISLLLKPPRHIDKEFQAFLRHRLKDYALSVTALNHFLEDPQMFLERDLLQVPQSKQASLVYGNAVHDALKQWALATKEGRGLGDTEFVAAFHRYLSEREVLTDAEHARLKALGDEALPRYYQQRLAGPPPCIGFVEYAVSTHLGDVPIKGKIDRIDLEHPASANAIVLDFKTGRPKTESQILEGDYFRQLVFYGLLLEHGMPMLTPSTFALDFIGEGAEHPVLRPFTVSEAQKKELAAVVAAVWAKIQALDFTPL